MTTHRIKYKNIGASTSLPAGEFMPAIFIICLILHSSTLRVGKGDLNQEIIWIKQSNNQKTLIIIY
jgi:hypothetical protein